MATKEMRMETGLFHSRHDAEEAVKLLRGLGHDDIDLTTIGGQDAVTIVGVRQRRAEDADDIPPRRFVR
jgi:hypothetical protein